MKKLLLMLTLLASCSLQSLLEATTDEQAEHEQLHQQVLKHLKSYFELLLKKYSSLLETLPTTEQASYRATFDHYDTVSEAGTIVENINRYTRLITSLQRDLALLEKTTTTVPAQPMETTDESAMPAAFTAFKKNCQENGGSIQLMAYDRYKCIGGSWNNALFTNE